MSHDPAALIARHETVKKRQRILRVVGPVVIVLLVAWNIHALVGMVSAFDQNRFGDALQVQGTKAWPRVKARLENIREDISPALEGAFVTEMERLNGELAGLLENEERLFRANTERNFEQVMLQTQSAQRLSREALVARHIPEVGSDKARTDNVISHVEAAAHQWVLRQWARRFEGHLVALSDIQKTLNRSYRLDTTGADMKRAPEDFVLLWLELFNETVAGNSLILGEAVVTPRRAR